MIGKKNIVFGFFYLVLTAALGPYIIKFQFPIVGEAQIQKQVVVGRLQQLAENEFEEELEPLTAKQIAKANTSALLGLNKLLNTRQAVDRMKGGPHAHGNLEALLNIVAGVVLCFIAVAPIFKQVISWVFMLGAVFHSGMLYLRAFGIDWAGALLFLGPWLILSGLLLIGVAALMGFKGEPVQDR